MCTSPSAGQGEAGTFALHQDYGPIAASARKAFIPVAGVLELALLGLYFALFPLLRRVTRRLRGHLRRNRAPGPPRRADRPPEPGSLPAPDRRGARGSPTASYRGLGVAPRPRPLQGDQRHARPPERRPAPAGPGRAARDPHSRHGYGGAPGRRRVRNRLTGRRDEGDAFVLAERIPRGSRRRSRSPD